MPSFIRVFVVNCVAFFVLALSGCAVANDSQTILILGDSLSAGYGIDEKQSWVALLQSRLNDQGYGYRVVNASISGDTTGGGLRRLPRALSQHEPGIVLIELGGNDGLRGTPVSVIRDNLRSMIELAQDTGARVILAGIEMPPNYGAGYTGDFSRMYPELATDYDAAYTGFFMKNVALNTNLMQPDGIHPNADGQPILLDNIWPALLGLLQGPMTASDGIAISPAIG
jgi:acyl-CoA thioesterase-1